MTVDILGRFAQTLAAVADESWAEPRFLVAAPVSSRLWGRGGMRDGAASRASRTAPAVAVGFRGQR